MPSDGDRTREATEAAAAGDWPALTEAIRRIPLHARMGLTVIRGGPHMITVSRAAEVDERSAVELSRKWRTDSVRHFLETRAT
jgi:hypothetical protein